MKFMDHNGVYVKRLVGDNTSFFKGFHEAKQSIS